LLRSALNSLFSDENALAQWFEGEGEVVLCDPLFPGKIAEIQLEPGEVMFLKRGSWLASTAGVSLTPTVEDATILALNFAKKVGSLGGASEEDSDSVLLRAEAVSEANDPTVKSHRLFFNSFGSIFHKRLEEGETYSVDNENLLAWSSSAEYSIPSPRGKGWSTNSPGRATSLWNRARS
jgi:uncharacterized protein (AIM24 family)